MHSVCPSVHHGVVVAGWAVEVARKMLGVAPVAKKCPRFSAPWTLGSSDTSSFMWVNMNESDFDHISSSSVHLQLIFQGNEIDVKTTII